MNLAALHAAVRAEVRGGHAASMNRSGGNDHLSAVERVAFDTWRLRVRRARTAGAPLVVKTVLLEWAGVLPDQTLDGTWNLST